MPAARPIISVSGLRGTLGESLLPEIICRYVAAFVDTLSPGPVLIGRDGRGSGPMVSSLVEGVLQAKGRDAWILGVAATPTVGFCVRRLGAAGGIQISASHNPPAYNGLKLFNDQGRVLPQAAGEQVLARLDADDGNWATHDAVGQVRELDRAEQRPHVDAVLAEVDGDAIARREYRVLLDANHGAGSVLLPALLERLGCKVELCGGEPDGQFAHPPEPRAENLVPICDAARSADCSVAFCLDPDADRLAIIDERGAYIGEELTLAICLDQVLPQRPGPVAINCATSQASADVAARHGCPTVRTAVGEANVVDGMLAQAATFGGEGNGGPIDPRIGWVRDSLVGVAQTLAWMAREDAPLSARVAQLPQYAIHKAAVRMPPEEIPAAFDRLTSAFADGAVDRQDGLRLQWADRWLLMRPSNTEPIVRIITEAHTASEAAALAAEAERVVLGA